MKILIDEVDNGWIVQVASRDLVLTLVANDISDVLNQIDEIVLARDEQEKSDALKAGLESYADTKAEKPENN